MRDARVQATQRAGAEMRCDARSRVAWCRQAKMVFATAPMMTRLCRRRHHAKHLSIIIGAELMMSPMVLAPRVTISTSHGRRATDVGKSPADEPVDIADINESTMPRDRSKTQRRGERAAHMFPLAERYAQQSCAQR